MIRLGVNIDHVATIRQARLEAYPDPVQAAVLAELGGADNITCHLREDRRHIQDRDVRILRETIKVPLNFEIAATREMVGIACDLQPFAVTLVPEKRQELTTEGGLPVDGSRNELADAVKKLKDQNILVSLFVEGEPRSVEMCHEVGADAIEIHTGDFCQKMEAARTTHEQTSLIRPFQEASRLAKSLGLQVHFGHGLHYKNAHWLQLIPEAEEANIGHAVIARAVFVGLKEAVAEMKDLLNNPQWRPNWQDA